MHYTSAAPLSTQARRLGDQPPYPCAILWQNVRQDRGRDGALVCAAPPSKPDGRISRIRLSSRRLTASGIAPLSGRRFIKLLEP